MISRLIELDDVLQTIDDFSSDRKPEGLKERLWKIQPVDAVPVVRCIDCKHLNAAGKFWFCAFGLPHPDGFCSYGEHRKDDNDG